MTTTSSLGTQTALTTRKTPTQRVTPLLLLAVFTAGLQSFNFGYNLGAIGNSQEAVSLWFMEHGAPITDANWALIVGILPFGGILGGAIGGPVSTLFGPKRAQMVNDMTFVIGGILMLTTRNIAMLCAGRFLVGIGSGLSCAAVPMYVSDISPTHVRGAFGVTHQLFINIGLLSGYILSMQAVMGTVALWRYLYGLTLLFGILQAVMLSFLPDSPRYLSNKGKYTEAVLALQRLRGTQDVHDELPASVPFQKQQETTTAQDSIRVGSELAGSGDISGEVQVVTTAEDSTLPKEPKQKKQAPQLKLAETVSADGSKSAHGSEVSLASQARLLFTARNFRTPVLATVGLQLFQQLSGINGISFYSSSIFESAGMTNSELGTVLVGVVNLVAILPAIPLMERAGRKPLMLVSLFGMAVCLLFLGVGIKLQDNQIWANAAVAFALMDVAAFAVGSGPIPWLVMAEIFPTHVASAAVGVNVLVNWTASSLVGLFFPAMQDAMGAYVFFLFSAVCVAGGIFVLKVVPETRGKTREEIDAMFL